MPSAQAMIQVGPATLRSRQLELPKVGPEEALLRVEGCGLCGSDVEEYDGALEQMGVSTFPVVPGHEPVGVIAEIGARAEERWQMTVGDRVAVHGVAPCGVCSSCRHGSKCASSFYYGFRSAEIGSGLWGGFAEFMHLDPRTILLPVSPGLSIQDAVFYNPLAAGFDWIETAGTRVGDSVLILGSGQRGLGAVIAAREAGASHIAVTGLSSDRQRLEMARTLGADTTIVADEMDVVATGLEVTRGIGFDRVLDLTPHAAQPVRDAVEVVRHAGTIVLAGLKGGSGLDGMPLDRVILKAVRLQGVVSTSPWAGTQAIRALESGRYDLSMVHTHTFPLEDLEEAILTLAGREGRQGVHVTVVPG